MNILESIFGSMRRSHTSSAGFASSGPRLRPRPMAAIVGSAFVAVILLPSSQGRASSVTQARASDAHPPASARSKSEPSPSRESSSPTVATPMPSGGVERAPSTRPIISGSSFPPPPSDPSSSSRTPLPPPPSWTSPAVYARFLILREAYLASHTRGTMGFGAWLASAGVTDPMQQLEMLSLFRWASAEGAVRQQL